MFHIPHLSFGRSKDVYKRQVLANDEVVDGVSERGGFPVIQKKMRQWCLRVSAYAQRCLLYTSEAYRYHLLFYLCRKYNAKK